MVIFLCLFVCLFVYSLSNAVRKSQERTTKVALTALNDVCSISFHCTVESYLCLVCLCYLLFLIIM